MRHVCSHACVYTRGFVFSKSSIEEFITMAPLIVITDLNHFRLEDHHGLRPNSRQRGEAQTQAVASDAYAQGVLFRAF